MFQRIYRYGRSVNSHDLVKVVATILMIVDHIGYYILGDSAWFRLIGRGAAPLFFFLVGYVPHHRFDWRLVIYGTILSAVNYFFFDYVFLNILINFVFIKAFLDYTPVEKLDNIDLIAIVLILILVNPLLSPYVEYGVNGILYALSARLMTLNDQRGKLLLILTVIHHFIYQALIFSFIDYPLQLFSVSLVGCSVLILLYHYKFRDWKVPLRLPLLIISRYSLAIYFWHLLFLKFYLLYLIFKMAQLIPHTP